MPDACHLSVGCWLLCRASHAWTSDTSRFVFVLVGLHMRSLPPPMRRTIIHCTWRHGLHCSSSRASTTHGLNGSSTHLHVAHPPLDKQTNMAHDILHKVGFVEAAGNFQTKNLNQFGASGVLDQALAAGVLYSQLVRGPKKPAADSGLAAPCLQSLFLIGLPGCCLRRPSGKAPSARGAKEVLSRRSGANIAKG